MKLLFLNQPKLIKMSSGLELTDHFRQQLVKLDFEYFLKRNANSEDYDGRELEQLRVSRDLAYKRLDKEFAKNRKQAFYHLDGQIAKMMRGGMLSTHFNLNDSVSFRILNFEEYGDAWGAFEVWKRHERKRVNKRRVWDWLTKGGAVLALILSVIKLLELFGVLK